VSSGGILISWTETFLGFKNENGNFGGKACLHLSTFLTAKNQMGRHENRSDEAMNRAEPALLMGRDRLRSHRGTVAARIADTCKLSFLQVVGHGVDTAQGVHLDLSARWIAETADIGESHAPEGLDVFFADWIKDLDIDAFPFGITRPQDTRCRNRGPDTHFSVDQVADNLGNHRRYKIASRGAEGGEKHATFEDHGRGHRGHDGCVGTQMAWTPWAIGVEYRESVVVGESEASSRNFRAVRPAERLCQRDNVSEVVGHGHVGRISSWLRFRGCRPRTRGSYFLLAAGNPNVGGGARSFPSVSFPRE